MNKTLSKKLEEISSEVSNSATSDSVYYTIGCLIVRVSDHFSTNSKHDIAIFDNGKSTFTLIPMVGMNKEVQWFTKVDELVEFLKTFEKMARLMLKQPEKTEFGVAKTKEVELMTKDAWKLSLSKYYGKSSVYDSLYDEFFEVSPKKSNVKQIKHAMCSSKNPAKSIEKLINAERKIIEAKKESEE